MRFKDEEPVKAIYNANNPKITAKHWEKTHRRADWGEILVDVIKYHSKTQTLPRFEKDVRYGGKRQNLFKRYGGKRQNGEINLVGNI